VKYGSFFRPALAPWACLLLGLVTVAAVYTPGLGGSWMFDDYPNIVDNRGVQVTDWTLASLTRAALASPASDFKRPLASLSFAINYLTTGASAPAMKTTNLVIHLLNGLFAFLTLRLVFASAGSVRGVRTSDGFWAAGSAIAWMLLPINLTAVLYVVQRMESMANLAVLLGLWAYLAGRRRRYAGRGGLVLALSGVLIGSILGGLAKETAVMLPLYAALAEAVLFRWRKHDGAGAPFDRTIVGFFSVVLVVPAILGTAWLAPVLLQPASWATRDFSLDTRLLSEARIVVDYIAWTVAPTPHALSFYHDDFVISHSLLDPATTILSLLVIIGLAVAAWLVRRRYPLASLGIAWYLGCHTLTGTVLPLELIYEHRNYFASLGLILVLASVLQPFLADKGKLRRLGVFAVVAFGMLWGGMTLATASAWGDPLSLARELALRAPRSPRAQYELGRTYIIYSKYDKSSPFLPLAYEPLERAAALPRSSILAEQALIFLNARSGLEVKEAWWKSMQAKLAQAPPTIQDESALDSLSKCVGEGSCKFDPQMLFQTFGSALSHAKPSPRLLAIYSGFAWDVMKDDDLAYRVQKEAVRGDPGEGAYHVTLARMAIRRGDIAVAQNQIQALSSMNVGGRFAGDIAALNNALASKEN
jgi:hypothetical protein